MIARACGASGTMCGAPVLVAVYRHSPAAGTAPAAPRSTSAQRIVHSSPGRANRYGASRSAARTVGAPGYVSIIRSIPHPGGVGRRREMPPVRRRERPPEVGGRIARGPPRGDGIAHHLADMQQRAVRRLAGALPLAPAYDGQHVGRLNASDREVAEVRDPIISWRVKPRSSRAGIEAPSPGRAN